MAIRRTTPEDIPAILELERQTPELAHWSEQAYKTVFDPGTPERIFLVSEIQGAAQGFLIARFTDVECELENIVVRTDHRRCGIAIELLQSLIVAACERGAKRILLEVRNSNNAARSLYAKLGFRENGRRKTYYNNPSEDAVLYTLAPVLVQKPREDRVTNR
jgi:ribosomal-protein-alanine acetyltransferase